MRKLLSILLLLLSLSASVSAQDWPHWRGPAYDGSAEASGLPTKFDLENQMLWQADLPGPGASTPIIIGKRMFLTSVDQDAQALLAICLDRTTGEELWIDVAGSGYRPQANGQPAGQAVQMHNRSNYASPSAVSDGEQVIFFFGNGDLISYTLEGDRRWERNLQKDFGDFAFQWTFSASPTLLNGRVYFAVLQRDEPANNIGKDGGESFLLALDAKDGETIYRHVRPSEAQMESLESYATIIPYTGTDGREEILVVGGDVVTGHNPATGEELWRWGTWNTGNREAWWRLVPSPVVGAGVVLACGPKGAPVCAVPLGATGLMAQDDAAWMSAGRRDPITTDVPTPLFYDGSFFVLSDLRNAITRVNPANGEALWSVQLPREHKWRASPTGADDKLWLIDHGGNVHVLDADTGETIHTVSLGDEEDTTRASIAVANSAVFVRTNRKVYCFSADTE
ncbi:MAG: outer membrane protein assembly factor BamB [Planctomycetota bacterium]|jgi:outer membrane protein assembly factor BamB